MGGSWENHDITPGLSTASSPDRDAVESLGTAYDRLVDQNPLPPRIKQAILAAALGGDRNVSRVLQATGRQAAPGQGDGERSTEEEVLLQLTRMAMATVPQWPKERLGPWKTVSGPNFGAWANLLAFAAQASVVNQCHLME